MQLRSARSLPGMLLAQTVPSTPLAKQQGQPVPIPTPTSDPEGDKPIVSDKDFNAALPKLSDDINAPLEPIPQDAPFTPQTADKAPASATAPPAPDVLPGTLPPPPEPPAELATPLPPLGSYNTAPVIDVAATGDKKGAQVRYDTVVNGLDTLGLDGDFRTLLRAQEGRRQGGEHPDGDRARPRGRGARGPADEEQGLLRRQRGVGDRDDPATTRPAYARSSTPCRATSTNSGR